MKSNKILRPLAIAIVLSLLIVAVPARPALADTIDLSPVKGEIGDYIDIDGQGFDPSRPDDDPPETIRVIIYFSSDDADVGDRIDDEVEIYKRIGSERVDEFGEFETRFRVPDEMEDGSPVRDVRGGTHYVYVVYDDSDRIVAVEDFTVSTADIDLNPDDGPVGTRVTINGNDFDGNEDITVEYDGDDVRIESGDRRTESDGDLTCTIIIPESTAGDHTITVTDDSGIEAEAEFTVEPETTVTPTRGAPGDTVTVEGTGFGPRVDVSIEFDGDEVKTDRTDSDGSFDFSFTVPETTPGTYDVQAEDDHGNRHRGDFTIIVTEIGLDPDDGPVGTRVRITGEDFDGNQAITMEYDGAKVAIGGGGRTDTSGKFNFAISIPESTAGEHTITVTDASGREAEAEFTVEPEITVAPTRGASGDRVTVKGTGFGQKVVVSIEFDGDEAATGETNTSGGFEVGFTVPARNPGTYDVEAVDSKGNKDKADFTTVAGIKLSKAMGNVGTEITISGSGFRANATITITYASEPVEAAKTTADANGRFSATFTAPNSEHGKQPITATDGSIAVNTTFTMESKPPPTPEPLLPEPEAKTKSRAEFDWEDVADPSGVTYTLQIATDERFTGESLLRDITGIVESEYSLTKEEKLESTEEEAPYYWRVRAVDGAANESTWTGAGSFHVGFVFALGGWVLYVLIALGVLIIFFVGRSLWRRFSYDYY
jgi:hypothetical protein